MIQKLKQIWNDHKAMQIFRTHFGDVHLTSVNGKFGESYECRIFQHEWYVEDRDPAVAILRAFERWNEIPVPYSEYLKIKGIKQP